MHLEKQLIHYKYRLIAACTVFVAACTCNSQAAVVVIGVPNWPSVQVTANIMKIVLEENLGLDVELRYGTNSVIFEGLGKGSIHVHPEVWLPNQQSLFDLHAALLVKNENVADGTQGICVNQAAQDAGIKNVADLTDSTKTKVLDIDGDGRGEVFIGASGWASTNVEKIKGQSYGYSEIVEMKEMEESLAYDDLYASQRKGEPWAGFCYTPHHLFIIYPDLIMLEEPRHDPAGWNVIQPDQDPKWLEKSSAAMAWPTAMIQPVFAKSLIEKHPSAARVMKNIDLNSKELSRFTYAVLVDQDEPQDFARFWIGENLERATGWLE